MQLASGPHSVWRYDGTGDWRPLSIDVRPFVVGSKGKSRCLRSRVLSGWTSEHETMSNLRWEEPASPKFWRSLWAAHGAPTTDFLMVSTDQHGRPSNPGEGEGH
ncbi:hypothetical protein GQ55_3G101300 [Panicum hallii var. hallii]|uniref:Uncharacterized protein n=1 Tax=Panicum hallii var. hallii TaxID=1504633 RepID=A0A2T7E7Q9_9POAL|nr:hypothetical protein GQ55_3G101300 [Panicum hallii var. hallii]PUZ63870.1 hypothetical protein GQ55_3G101300 [Panicum hallii var. hallii]